MREHGTRAKYVHEKCRCPLCRAANAAYQQSRYNGSLPSTAPIEPVLAHVQMLRRHGLGTRSIAMQAGVHRSSVQMILRHEHNSVFASTFTALMSLQPDQAPRVDVVGTARRLQALMAVGWSSSLLARRLRMDTRRVRFLATCSEGQVTRRTHERVMQAYNALLTAGSPSSPAAEFEREQARKLGWSTPMAWADRDMDDPAASPDPPWRPQDRTVAELAEDVNFLIEMGETMPAIASRLGISESYARKLKVKA